MDTIGSRHGGWDTSRYGRRKFPRITQDVLRAAIDGGHQEILKQIVKDGAQMFTASFVLHDAGLMIFCNFPARGIHIYIRIYIYIFFFLVGREQ